MTLLNDTENRAAGKFVWEHYDRKCGGKKNAALELKAESNGIGFSITIRCPNCKATKDISDTDSW